MADAKRRSGQSEGDEKKSEGDEKESEGDEKKERREKESTAALLVDDASPS